MNERKAYFTEDVTGLSFGFLYRVINSAVPFFLAFPITLVIKCRNWLGISSMATHGQGDVGTAKPVPIQEWPVEARALAAAELEVLRDLNFTPLRFRITDTIGNKRAASSDWLSPDRQIIATLQWICIWNSQTTNNDISIELNSFGSVDPEYMTMWMKPEDVEHADAMSLPFIEIAAFPKTLTLRSVIDSHRSRIDGKPVYFLNANDAGPELDRRNQRRMKAAMERGIYRRLTDAEVRKLTSGA